MYRGEAASVLASAREPETSIARAHAGLGQAQLATNEVGALNEGDALVVGDPSAQPLAAEAAVGGDHESLGWDVLERFPDDVGVELEQVRYGALIARRPPVHALLVGVSPARVHPDLGVDVRELPVECLGEELEVGVLAVGPRGAPVVGRLLDLDERTASGG